MCTVVDIAQVVAMFAALVAVWFARQAAVETRALRHEERVARLLELVGDIGERGTAAARGSPMVARPQLVVAQHRLRAAVAATKEQLPACDRLLTVEWPEFVRDADASELERKALDAVATALDEVAALLVRLREQGS
jgi:hypothetical protein